MERVPDGLGLRDRESPVDFGAASRGTLPAKCREAGPRIDAGGGGVKRPGKTRAQLARRWGQRSPQARGLQGQGRNRRPWATCSARAVRAEARAQSPPGGGCAPARSVLPAPTRSPGLRPPGGGSGRCRGLRPAGRW